VAPSILALGYANYSNRGDLLVRTKGLQLVVFLILATILIPPMGPLGAAAAIVTGDLLIQFGLLGIIVMRQTLERPFLHLAVLAVLMAFVTLGGWALGALIRAWVPGTGLIRFITECALWLTVVVLAASPLASNRIRSSLIAGIPR
jgi:O-antigen/teichoic acid export membrane protein